MKNVIRPLCLLLLALAMGCQSTTDFHVKDLVKSDIDQVSDIHMNQAVDLLKDLTRKLYRRNPGELAKAPGHTIDSRIQEIFRCPGDRIHEELESKTGTEAILLAFEPDFPRDRVFAVMYGLHTMIRASYNDRCELFMLDYLDSQNLYNSARNIEILVWRLKTRTDAHGVPLLLTNSTNGNVENLSFERLFGKLIAVQDTLAVIIGQRTGRFFREVIQTAGMAFLPIGI